ncbi:ATP-binding cassette domain-containing protein [Candidatus Phytoplasma melaleucae]|uniref:ATP-binding cassette domain-containing protein n=1 Tax=Candidatus Phytoplasma melaleucae TaxID=2982630 RepID=A0ABT9DE24_9MOLU|nr:ATP-binding cassette domain-containing protein ['Melaleuca sp.' phytoplasma]MDO8168098.1 ATP-binding cassette domain-containing protein ['Melaleuca sp.' phytoplasma]
MAIQFKNVTFYYKKKEKYAIQNINLTINQQNEFIAIIGPIGSGKSTLVQMMNGLLLPSEGHLEVFHQKISAKNSSKKLTTLRKKIGLIFQFPEYQLFETTVLKDVMFTLNNFKQTNEVIKKISIDALNKVGITSDLFYKSPFQLSSGQQRKVAIAGILVMNPFILILDEPTRGLDNRSQLEIMHVLKQMYQNEKKTIIFITHDMDLVAEYANRVIFLEKGEIIFDGMKDDFFSHKKFSELELYEPQTFKISRLLEKKLNISFYPTYSYKNLLEYLRKFYQKDNIDNDD